MFPAEFGSLNPSDATTQLDQPPTLRRGARFSVGGHGAVTLTKMARLIRIPGLGDGLPTQVNVDTCMLYQRINLCRVLIAVIQGPRLKRRRSFAVPDNRRVELAKLTHPGIHRTNWYSMHSEIHR